MRNTVTGLDGVPADVKEAAVGMGYSRRRQLLLRVELPLALPAIIAGIRIATVTTIGLVTVTALIGQGGLGQLMLDGFQRDFRTPLTVGIVLSLALAVVADLLLVLAQRLATPWTRTARWRRKADAGDGLPRRRLRLPHQRATSGTATRAIPTLCSAAPAAHPRLGARRRARSRCRSASSLGHVRTGGAIAVNIANIGRALPALALLILAVQWVGIGEPDRRPHARCSRCPRSSRWSRSRSRRCSPTRTSGWPSVDDEIRESARGMGMNGRQMLWRVELPMAMPLIMAGDPHRDRRGGRHRDARGATSTPAGFGRYIVDGFAVQDNVKVFAGGLLVALLAVALELLLALVQRGAHLAGHPSEARIKVRDLATDRIAPTGPAL